MFYYNYRMIDSCKKPLLGLLEALSRGKALKTDVDQHARTLFVLLKGFYDPRETLCLEEAVQDKNLLKRFRNLFLLFCGKENLTREELEGWLKPLNE